MLCGGLYASNTVPTHQNCLATDRRAGDLSKHPPGAYIVSTNVARKVLRLINHVFYRPQVFSLWVVDRCFRSVALFLLRWTIYHPCQYLWLQRRICPHRKTVWYLSKPDWNSQCNRGWHRGGHHSLLPIPKCSPLIHPTLSWVLLAVLYTFSWFTEAHSHVCKRCDSMPRSIQPPIVPIK